VARLVVILAVLLTAAASADARPAAGTRARIRAETWQAHRDRLVAAGKIHEARAASRELARHYRRAGKPVEAEWARVFADQWKLERESQNRGPLLAVAPGRRLAMAEIEESLVTSRARPALRLIRLAALYEQENMLQEAAWALAEAGPAHAARVRRLERRLERILAGPVVALHPVMMDGRRVTLAELDGGIFAVFKLAREVRSPEASALPEAHAYKVDRMLGLGLVPVSVARTGARAIDGQDGTLQYFFKYGTQLKRTAGTRDRSAQTSRMRDLRTILSDPDGHNGNAFVLPAGRQAAIDAGQAFLWNSSLPRRLEDPALAAALGAIDRRALRRALGAPLAGRLIRYWQPLVE
jgi:hypothetical protein